MPILAMSAGVVTAVWGTAFVRLPDGKLKPVKVGDKVKGGEHIITEADGIVQITPVQGPAIQVKPPVAQAKPADIDRAIAALDNPTEDEAPAAGLTGGAQGGLLPGLRVDRVSESVDGLSFEYGTDRGAQAQPVATVDNRPLFEASVIEIVPTEPSVVSVNSVTVNEAAQVAQFIVSLDRASSTTVTVRWTTSGGTATAGADYEARSGVVTFAPGETSKVIEVPILDDDTFENSEFFNLVLSDAVNATLGNSGTGTIKDDGTGSVPPGVTPDDDTPKVIEVSSPTAAEGGDLDFVVKLSNDSTTPTVVKLKLGDPTGQTNPATPGEDTGAPKVSFDGGKTFEPVTVGPDGTATITVPANTPVDQVVVRVPTIKDGTSEPTETFTLQAQTPAQSTPAEGVGSITDTNGAPTVSLSGPAEVNEAAGTITYTVTLSNPSSQPVTVTYKTADGTAEASTPGKDGDYIGKTGTVTFAPGQTTATITVDINDDDTFEGSETFSVELSDPVGATLGAGSTVTTAIKDDGTGSVPPGVTPDDDRATLAVTGGTVVESAGHGVFTVTLSNPLAAPTVLKLALSDGGAGQAASGGGVDYGTATGSSIEFSVNGGLDWIAGSEVTVPAGQTTVLVRTAIVNDTAHEFSESVSLTVTAADPVPFTATSSTGTLVITDDDVTAPKLTIDSRSYHLFEDFEEVTFGSAGYTQAVIPSTLSSGDGVLMTGNASGRVEIGLPSTYGVTSTSGKLLELERSAGDKGNLHTDIQARAGEVYTFSVDYAARGDHTTNSAVYVYWGGQLVGVMDTRSTTMTNFVFTLLAETSGTHRLELLAGDSNSFGGLVDNTRVDLLPNTGYQGYKVSLPVIGASLVDVGGSPESLSLTIGGLPDGAVLTDGVHTFTATAGTHSAMVTDWDLTSLVVVPPAAFTGDLSLSVTATATDTVTGVAASTTSAIDLKILADTGNAVGTAGADVFAATAAGQTLMGLDGDDRLLAAAGGSTLIGGSGNDTLEGGEGRDVLSGGTGDDRLMGGGGDDVLQGGEGDDRLTGGAGADVFAWHLGDAPAAGAGRATDTITDFDVRSASAGGDVLDLRDLLQGENASNLTQYLDFDTSSTPGSTIIKVSTAGGFAGGTATEAAENQRIVLEGVNLRADLGLPGGASDADVINKLMSLNKLVVDNG